MRQHKNHTAKYTDEELKEERKRGRDRDRIYLAQWVIEHGDSFTGAQQDIARVVIMGSLQDES